MKTVNVVIRETNSQWPEDITTKVARVYSGRRIKAAVRWADEQEKLCKNDYNFRIETWEVE